MGTVSPLTFRNALFNDFADFWAGRTEIAEPNKSFDPDKDVAASDTAFVRLFILGRSDGETRLSDSVTPAHFSNEVIFTATVNVRAGAGMDEAYALAEAVRQWARKHTIPATIIKKIGTPVELGSTGSWFEVSVSAECLYWSDEAA